MSRRLAVLLPVAVLLAGLAATALGTTWLHMRTQDEAQVEFQRIVALDSNEISERFRKPVYGLNGARGVYATHPEVLRNSFLRYVNSRNLPVEFPGVRGRSEKGVCTAAPALGGRAQFRVAVAVSPAQPRFRALP